MIYSLSTANGTRLVDIPEYLKRKPGLTIVAYWKDSKVTVVRKGIDLTSDLLEAVKVIVHGSADAPARVLTIPARH